MSKLWQHVRTETAYSEPAYLTPGMPQESEYQELLNYGEYTFWYCFSEFLQGGQTDLRGQNMALICRNIMLMWGEGYAIDQNSVTRQDWFDAFKECAESLDIQYSDEDMEKYYPGTWFEWWSDEGLNRRGDDSINSRLNYGYAVVRSSITRSLVAAEFLSTFGMHHDS